MFFFAPLQGTLKKSGLGGALPIGRHIYINQLRQLKDRLKLRPILRTNKNSNVTKFFGVATPKMELVRLK